MAWTTIEIVGETPLQAAHPVEFLGPAAYGRGNVLQFFAIGGYVTAWRAAHMIMQLVYRDHRMYKVDPGADGSGVYVRLYDSPMAAKMHGDVFWVRDTLVCCVQVNPELLHDARLPPVYPIVRVLHPGS